MHRNKNFIYHSPSHLPNSAQFKIALLVHLIVQNISMRSSKTQIVSSLHLSMSLLVSISPCLYLSLSLSLLVSISPCLYLSLPLFHFVSILPCLYLSLSIFHLVSITPCLYPASSPFFLLFMSSCLHLSMPLSPLIFSPLVSFSLLPVYPSFCLRLLYLFSEETAIAVK